MTKAAAVRFSVCLVVLLVLAFHVQRLFKLVELRPLQGVFRVAGKPEFTTEAWLSGEYQTGQSQYTEEKIGFRPLLVRLYNQINYSLFGKANSRDMVIGKEEYIFQTHYIDAWMGTDFIGKEEIDHTTQQLKWLQDELKSRSGTDLLVVLVPGKASFYHEYLPERYQQQQRLPTNHQHYTERLQELGINHIDFYSYFASIKEKSPYPLFPKTGIHWSVYGMGLATDSMLSYIGKLRGTPVPDLEWEAPELTDKLQEPDDDAEQSMNLLFRMPSNKMAYPDYTVEQKEGQVKPKVLAVADSYYASLFERLHHKVFDNGGFWYYAKKAYTTKLENPQEVKELNVEEELTRQDVVLLLTTDFNLTAFPWGFLDIAGKALLKEKYIAFDPATPINKIRIGRMLNKIKADREWYLHVKKQAEEQQKPLETMLWENAEFMVRQQYEQK